ncbi:MAG: MFS transporter [Burkholderiaceae bacterium]|nr:MFS transporter [Burkholderiaceae bacterium]MCD8516924.1 MFS transporter [Burkholderiaceae bacterium]MCD8537557.1 MFS transporter [Burkholderiaceae bacterium]MCD8565632.1 MFS transporter [Burkholderiaceae bacterium]
MGQPVTARRAILSGVVGNVLEWFDFAIYGFFAVTIGKIFFPQEDPVAQVLAAFGVFAIGFLMRPVGGILLGHIGDKHGRHKAMLVSVILMAVPTFLVGILPGYETLGLAAPVLLLLLRMLQGLSVGGEYTTSIVYMIENAHPGNRGLAGSLSVMGAVGGILLGSAVGAGLAANLSEADLQQWGWRVPFVLGLLLGLAAIYLRRGLHVVPVGIKLSNSPFVESIKHHRGPMLQVAGLSVINATVFQITFIYIVSWLETVDGLPPQTALQINTVSMAALLPMMLLGGWLSDRVGGKPVLVTAAVLITALAWPLFWLMHHSSLPLIYAGQLGFSVVLGLYIGAQPAYIVKVIAPHVRCTALGLGYNITLGLAGGLSPMTATWLVHRTHDDLSPAYIIIVTGLLALLALWSVRESQMPVDPGHLARAQELLAAVDRGGVPSNPMIVNSIARSFGLDVKASAPLEETIQRIRHAVNRAS